MTSTDGTASKPRKRAKRKQPKAPLETVNLPYGKAKTQQHLLPSGPNVYSQNKNEATRTTGRLSITAMRRTTLAGNGEQIVEVRIPIPPPARKASTTKTKTSSQRRKKSLRVNIPQPPTPPWPLDKQKLPPLVAMSPASPTTANKHNNRTIQNTTKITPNTTPHQHVHTAPSLTNKKKGSYGQAPKNNKNNNNKSMDDNTILSMLKAEQTIRNSKEFQALLLWAATNSPKSQSPTATGERQQQQQGTVLPQLVSPASRRAGFSPSSSSSSSPRGSRGHGQHRVHTGDLQEVTKWVRQVVLQQFHFGIDDETMQHYVTRCQELAAAKPVIVFALGATHLLAHQPHPPKKVN
eukprot:TRINITY_DN67158_c4_g13_i1.p1 TRINITY_DN67158_c4_g13~~TRINITY_DN67158_c4_g13_i1.p1  ORF type:complete len:350 (-),score=44.34 TRINITY_DN67158_c4_g13_i1:880-1929(-)